MKELFNERFDGNFYSVNEGISEGVNKIFEYDLYEHLIIDVRYDDGNFTVIIEEGC